MKIKLFFLLTLSSIFSCQVEDCGGDFKLLPHPKEWEIKGNSKLSVTDLKYYFNPSGISLPAGSDFLDGATATNERDEAQLVYIIDNDLESKAEGYLMNINLSLIHI